MSYHPKQESDTEASFLTTRSRNSELWFIQNHPLEHAILGYAAKYRERYGVKLYGLAIEGNHIQGPALFPNMNRKDFMRDFNSSVARAIPRYCELYPGGKFWERRYSSEIVPTAVDIESCVLYTALQPVQDGLFERLSDYPGYKFFYDAINGIERKFKVVNWKRYNQARKRDRTVPIEDYTEIVVLKYDRIPGYEQLSWKDYAKLMMEKLEKRRIEEVNKRIAKGLGFLGLRGYLAQIPGSRPRTTKKSTYTSHRPRVLAVDPETRAEYKARYFDKYWAYKAASLRYRQGELDVEFPRGMYRPYCWHQPPPPPTNAHPN